LSTEFPENPGFTCAFRLHTSAGVGKERASEHAQEHGQDGEGAWRAFNRLSDVAVRAKKRPGYVADGGNMHLRVAPGATKGWIFRFTIAGRTRDAGLGAYPTVSLVKAREEAEKCRRLVAAGVDPILSRNEERQRARIDAVKGITFEQCAKSVISSHAPSWKNNKTTDRGAGR